MKKALLIIDIQPDFLPGGRLAVNEGDLIIPLINGLQQDFDLVVASQDWHPAGHQSFASSHAGRRPFEEITLHGLPQTLWPDHCEQGHPGADLSPLLDTARVEAIFRKGTDPTIDSYSAFFDNGHRRSTGLAAYLHGRGITEVYVVGLAGDYCVYYSALDALAEHFDTYIITDAIRSIDPARAATTQADFVARGGHLLTAAEFIGR